MHLFLLCIHSVKSLGGNGVVTVKTGKKRALTSPLFYLLTRVSHRRSNKHAPCAICIALYMNLAQKFTFFFTAS